jgi:hypothetical protein
MSDQRGAKQYPVTIDEETCTVTVMKTGAQTWTARGNFRGKPGSMTGRSESAALDAWRRWADYAADE